jgi:hypothetical protein
MSFLLDENIASSSVFIKELHLCELRLKNQAAYPWCILIPRVLNCREIYELDMAAQQQLMHEIVIVSKVMQDYFKPFKLNIGSLGNIVSQLHIHIVGRNMDDPLWPHGIWQEGQKNIYYRQTELDKIVADLQTKLDSAFSKR